MDSKYGEFTISYVHVNLFEELVRVVGCFTLSTFEDWGKSPIVGGGVPPMARLPCLAAVMKDY